MPQLELTYVGTEVPRIEGRAKVTGATRYAVDAVVPGMLVAKVLRSTVPHARITRIDTTQAKAVPGVHAVITGDDIGNMYTGGTLRDMPLLCTDRVRYVGDAIAAVAAESAEAADDALKLIQVELAELPGVFSPAAALQPGAELLHPDRASYHGNPEKLPGPNLQGETRVGKGDIAQGFAEADLIFEHTFSTAARHQGYIEPRACMVQLADDGTVRVWSSCQSPFSLRDLLASLLGLPKDQVIVEQTAVGGSFGAKGSVGMEPVAYFLAKQTGRAVKMVPSYNEELIAGNPRHPAEIHLKTGVKRDGTLVARQARITMDGGAYAAYKGMAGQVLPSVARALGPYRIPHTEITAQFVYTNNTPGGVARAPAQPQVVFAGESQMDAIAAELGLDPLEFRLKNVVERDDEVWPSNNKFEGVMTRQTLELLRQASNWDAPLGPNQARGLAMSERGIGVGQCGLTVTLRPDGMVHALSGIADVGTGAHTIIRQILAEELHVPIEAVTVSPGSTGEALFDAGIGGSKHTFSLTVASMDVSKQVTDHLREIAAQRLEAAPDDLELVGQEFRVQGSPSLRVPVQEVAAEAATRAGGTFQVQSEGPDRTQRAPQSCIVAYAAEVEVDPESGQVTVRRLTAAHDAGFAINPQLLQAQVDGATIQGLGMAVMEEIPREDGRQQAANLGDYKLPTVADVPELVSVYLEGASGPGPYQAKAVAELSNVTIPAAIANAVARACGARVAELPVTAERVLAALANQGTPASH